MEISLSLVVVFCSYNLQYHFCDDEIHINFSDHSLASLRRMSISSIAPKGGGRSWNVLFHWAFHDSELESVYLSSIFTSTCSGRWVMIF